MGPNEMGPNEMGLNEMGLNEMGPNEMGPNEMGPNIDNYTLFFDGCSKGNPGKAGAGAVIYKNDIEIWAKAHYVGAKQTNNYAEYMGLLVGLEEAVKQRIPTLTVKGDSLLVIKQMRGEYKINAPTLLTLNQHARTFLPHFTTITFEHVYRAKNKRADALSNEALQNTST